MKELWRAVFGYVSLYEVSNLGHVRNAKRLTNLSPTKTKHSYPHVSLYRDRIPTSYNIHALVATAFHGKCPKGKECRHLDGNKRNSNAENLAWATKKNNEADKIAHGTSQHGERNHQTQLSIQDVQKIKAALRVVGVNQRALAKKFHVIPQTINEIAKGRNWRHV